MTSANLLTRSTRRGCVTTNRRVCRMTKRAFVVAAALVAVVCSRASAAPRVDKRTCLATNESAQRLRKDGKLRGAREQLVVCARTECPLVVRQDCAQWLNEVGAAIPSVVVAARDASGKETLAVKVA